MTRLLSALSLMMFRLQSESGVKEVREESCEREMCSDLSFQTLACITPRGARAPPQSDVTVQNKREYPPPQQVLNGGEDNSICNSSNYES